MKTNMGSFDRVLRALVATTIAILIFTQTLTGTMAIVAGILGGVFLLTALVGVCPLYLPFGIKTCSNAAR